MGALSAAALALVLALILVPGVAQADDSVVSSQEAHRAALAWLYTSPAFARGKYTPAPGLLEVRSQDRTQIVAYVLQLQPTGFIIVTPNRELNPIIAYSENSIFDATETPENTLLYLLRSDVPSRLEALERGYISSQDRAEAKVRWNDSLEIVNEQGRLIFEADPMAPMQYAVEHGPFLTSVWDQSTDGGGDPVFNYYSPNEYVCGCVATALGQILNYYEWPVTGTGSHSYIWDGDGGPTQTLSADFGATTYDWPNALDVYTDTGYTDAQRQAAGRVTYDAGVAVEMDYGASGSGASTSDVAGALQNYFRASGEWVENTGSSFYDRLYANMINHRPAQLSIQRVGGGHSVVADGIRHDTGDDDNKTRYYHLNMGWGNDTSGTWYDLPDVGIYTTVYGAVMDVVPIPDMDDPGGTIPDAYFPVTWDVAALQDATQYELQQTFLSNALSDFSDDAESGTGNWSIDGYWNQSSFRKHQGSYAFHGNVNDGVSGWYYPGTLTLNQMVKVDSSTTISYYWGAYYAINQELRLEISTDGFTWATLESHTDDPNSLTWYSETVTTAELSSYVGETVNLRFVVDYLGGTYTGSTPGFYIDEFVINDAKFGTWATIDDTLTTESKSLIVTEDGEYFYQTRAGVDDPSIVTSTLKWMGWSDMESVTVSGLRNSDSTGDWDVDGTWDVGSVPSSTVSAIVNNGHIVTADSNADAHDLVVQSGGTLVVDSGGTLSVGDDLVNSGTLEQTRNIGGSSDVGFFNIGGYGGVLINANGLGDLGSTVVTIKGNQDCTTGDSGSSVQRCLDIAPTNFTGISATVRFYFSASEVVSPTCGAAKLWHWNGSIWEEAGTFGSRQCATDPYYVEYGGVDSFSPFVVDDDMPAGNPLDPTAVTLSSFEATPAAGSILVTWETAIEIDNVGFNLYRSEAFDGPYVKLNDSLIPSQSPGAPFGAEYAWLDEVVEPDVIYYYKLEDVEVGGQSTFHGPVSVSAQAPTVVSVAAIGARESPAVIGVPVGLLLMSAVGLMLVRRDRRKV